MFIALYAKNAPTTFTPPIDTPSALLLGQKKFGSNNSVWICESETTPAYWFEITCGDQPPACLEEPPTTTAGFNDGDQCFYNDPTTICYELEGEVTEYYWTLIQDGYKDIAFSGLVTDVLYTVTKRVYDKDTSTFEGICNESLENPFIFVLKEDDGTQVYSGFVAGFSQDGKHIKFKGIDFKTILDTEMELDFYSDASLDILKLRNLLSVVTSNISEHGVTINFVLPNDYTDTTYISNLRWQVIRVNGLKFLKPYLALFAFFMVFTFNEGSKEVSAEFTKSKSSMTIRLEDFVFERSKTEVKTNHAIATISRPQEDDSEKDLTYIETTQDYYDQLPDEKKFVGEGIFIPEVELLPGPSYVGFATINGVNYLNITYYYWDQGYDTALFEIVTNLDKKFLFYIPYHKNLSLRGGGSSTDIGAKLFASTTAFGAISQTVSLYTGLDKDGKQGVIIPPKQYTDFGQGWFYIDLFYGYSEQDYIEFYIPIIGIENPSVELGQTFLDEMANKISAAPIDQINRVQNYQYGVEIPEEPFLGYPKDPILYEEELDTYGDGYKVSLPLYNWYFGGASGPISLAGKLGTSPINKFMIDIILDASIVIVSNGVIVRSTDTIQVDLPYPSKSGIVLQYEGSYGRITIYGNNTYENTTGRNVQLHSDGFTRYWQVGQIPSRPRVMPKREYFLGNDNELYADTIPGNKQLFPIQTKYFEDQFLYKAQFNAVYDLVNSRYNENIVILDNSKVNPKELEPLGLNASITVYDKNNATAILPVSEIEIRNGEKRVKLGFKKTLFTEVIKV